MQRYHFLLASPGRTLIISIVSMIIFGSLFLSSSWALQQPQSLSFLDSLFTSVSATCVTGLLTVPISHFSFGGQLVLLLLMQIGGLGLITLTIFFMSLFFEIGFGTQVMAEQLLEIDRFRKSRYMIGFIIIFSFVIELIGTIGIFLTLPAQGLLSDRIFYSVFHSVSAFCSAGFVIFPEGIPAFQTNSCFLLITTFLMLTGELGFIVWHDIILYARAKLKKKPFRFSLHTKIVLSMTSFLITLSAIIIWLLEKGHSL